MSNLLTHEEYQAIARDLSLPLNPYINGKFAAPLSGQRMPTVNPATGDVLGEMANCGAEDVDLAVTKAREAFDRGDWSRMHPGERKEVMIQLCKLMQRDRHQLAVMESLESGKPIQECAMTDVPETIACLKWHAEATDKLYDQLSPSGDDAVGMIVREPIGVAACVLPWNFPLMMLAWKIGPALSAGNSVIVKPAEQTSIMSGKFQGSTHAATPMGSRTIMPTASSPEGDSWS